jgi:very-short-patch-repair endonuclease
MAHEELAALGEGTLGIWSRAAALRLMTPGALDHRVASGQWQLVWPGVYADGGYVLSPEQRAVAAVLGSGHDPGDPNARVAAVACGRTAARVLGLPLVDDDDPAVGGSEGLVDDVHTFRAASGRSRVVQRGTRRLVRHRLTLGPDDLAVHESGLRLTSALRTVCDCARLLSFEAAVCVADAALHARLVTAAELAGAVRVRAGVPGVRRLAAVVAASDGRAESAAESLARLVLRPALPGLTPQVRVRDEAGRVVARLDLGDEEMLFAVEVDGRRGHAGAQMVAKDRRRDRRTDALGWRVERVTWHDLRARPDLTRAWVRAAAQRHAERSL